ncbi:glycosyltransferase [Pedobacter sp. BMA]|uniref:glycosyltransferase n=1 Tax=Pedobacter sp. BMA TaxID=1663685 RepID=UPI00069E422F|nr:glycosyltransferase [Pedobacter sp. BMA]
MSETLRPLISVALCTFNGEKHITEQLESILSQSYESIEIIICDDQSTDGTFEILKRYASNYPIISLYQNDQNLGFVKNFEQAISRCTGDYIALSDQDDVWMIEKLTTLITQIGDSDMIYHDSNLIDKQGKLIPHVKMSDHYRSYDGTSNLPFLISNCVAGHAMLFKSTLISVILPFNSEFYHDWWITFVAITIGKIKAIPDILVNYRQHDLAITDTLNLKKQDDSTGNKGFLNYNLNWINYCSGFSLNNRNQKEIRKIYYYLVAYQEGLRGFRLFFFLLRYYHILFYFHLKGKNKLSQLNTIRKICFNN